MALVLNSPEFMRLFRYKVDGDAVVLSCVDGDKFKVLPVRITSAATLLRAMEGPLKEFGGTLGYEEEA